MTMNTALWIAQSLLAVAFSITGLLKVAVPYAELAARAGWVTAAAPMQVRLIGVLELLAVAGMLLPLRLHLLEWLTPLAALGLVLTMIVATVVHIQRQEYGYLPLTLLLLLLAAFVAYGRTFAATS